MLKKIINVLEDVKLEDIKIYDMENKSPFYDYMVVASAKNQRQNQAALKYLKEMAFLSNYDIKNVEGNNSSWILVDMYNVVIHIFTSEERTYYALDKLYFDYKKISIKDL